MSFFREIKSFLRTKHVEISENGGESSVAVCEEVPLSDDFIKTWRDRLIQMADELTGASSATEAEFLAIGKSLQEFSGSCSTNSSRSSEIAGLIESGKGFNFSLLEELFDKAYKHAGACTGSISTGISDMAGLKNSLKELSGLQLFLKDLSRSINIIGILSRIETARLDGAEFNSMTSVIDDLAMQIAKSTEEIAASAKDAGMSISGIQGEMHSRLEALDKELAAAQKRVAGLLEEMSNLKTRAALACRRIEDRSSRIIAEIGEVVAALQYHDICRQQMEHAAGTLKDIAARIDDNFIAGDEKAAFSVWAAKALGIQISQLQNVVSKTASAAGNISRHLTRVSDLSEAQTEEAGMILEEEQTGSLKIRKISAELEALSGVTRDCKSATSEMLGAVSEAGSKIGRMSEHAANIKSISENINLLAMNAIIKVAHTGDSGRTLEVLADKIRTLSLQVREEIVNGAERINAVLRKSAGFRETLSKVLSEQLAGADEICGQTRLASGGLLEANKSLMQSLSDISALTNRLTTGIAELASGIRFSQVIKMRVGGIVSELQKMLNGLAETFAEDEMRNYKASAADLSVLAKRYTMESERDVHDSILTSYAGGGKASMKKKPGSNGDKPSNSKDDLGDNVELF